MQQPLIHQQPIQQIPILDYANEREDKNEGEDKASLIEHKSQQPKEQNIIGGEDQNKDNNNTNKDEKEFDKQTPKQDSNHKPKSQSVQQDKQNSNNIQQMANMVKILTSEQNEISSNIGPNARSKTQEKEEQIIKQDKILSQNQDNLIGESHKQLTINEEVKENQNSLQKIYEKDAIVNRKQEVDQKFMIEPINKEQRQNDEHNNNGMSLQFKIHIDYVENDKQKQVVQNKQNREHSVEQTIGQNKQNEVDQQQQVQSGKRVDSQEQQAAASADKIQTQPNHPLTKQQENKVQQSLSSQQPPPQQQSQIEPQHQQLEPGEEETSIIHEPEDGGKSKYNIITPQPISLTEENEPCFTFSHITEKKGEEGEGKEKKIVQFVEYQPLKVQIKKEKQSEGEKESKKSQIDQKYANISNSDLLKRIRELEQIVKELKYEKKKSRKVQNSEQQNNQTVTQTIEDNTDTIKSTIQVKKSNKDRQIIHDHSVHGLVTELAKNQSQETGTPMKKPVLHQIRYKKKKLDLSALMDKNMVHASNIYNLTIGEILQPNLKDEQEKEELRREIRILREKVIKLEQDKRTLSNSRLGMQNKRESASTGKKSMCGKLIKVSELKASRVMDVYQTDAKQKVADDNKDDKGSQRDSVLQGPFFSNYKKNNASATQRQAQNSDKPDREKDSNSSICFRVRRPSNKLNPAVNVSSFINDSKELNNQQQSITIEPATNIKSKINTFPKQIKKEWWLDPFIEPFKIPQLPSPPTPYDSQEDLYTLGRLTFISFGVNVDSSKQMSVKKYKNCVFFNLGDKNTNILWYFDGRFYFGEWQIYVTGEGEKSGEGFEYVPDKFVYQGQFKQGKRNGFGRMKLLNKEKQVIYEGNWADGNKTGEGKQIDQYKIKYWGEWKDNKRDGFGRLKLEDGDLYEGNFDKGIKTGFGREYFKNGDKYEGNYVANKFHGIGKYTWKNGSVYEGDFVHGIRSGHGTWRSNENEQEYDEYEGDYENDKKNGFGKYRWADGSEYQGYFKNDLKEGEGTIRYKNGKVAKILWKNGQPLKKIFSEEEKKYREGQKSLHKNNSVAEKANEGNRNKTYSSRNFSIYKDD